MSIAFLVTTLIMVATPGGMRRVFAGSFVALGVKLASAAR